MSPTDLIPGEITDFFVPDTVIVPSEDDIMVVPRPNTLVIRVKLADHLEDRPGEPAEPTPAGGYEAFFTTAGAGQGAVYDYLNAQMMGQAYYDADITPWYPSTLTEADLLRIRAEAGRFGMVSVCAEAASRDFQLASYSNLVIIVNAPSTSDGSRGGDFTGGYPHPLVVDGLERMYGITICGSSGFDLNGLLQELLHAYPVAGRTMQHGRHAYLVGMASDSEYGDPYDVMSAYANFSTDGPWGQQGASLCGARRAMAGWVPEARNLTYVPNDSLTYPDLSVELQPLGADQPGTQLITVPVGDDAQHYYVVEHRSRTGWDSVLPRDGILIHEVRPDSTAYLMTRRPGPQAERDAQWLSGERWTAALSWGSRVEVAVDRTDASGSTVRLSAG